MSATHIGTLNNGILNRTFGDTIEFLPDGGAKAVVHYYCKWALSLNLVPVKYAVHPDFPWLLLTNWKNERDEGDIAKIECVYQGAQRTDQLPEPESQFEVLTSAEPIETHPRYANDTDGNGGVSVDDKNTIRLCLGATNKNDFNTNKALLSGLALEMFKKKMNGVTSFLIPTISYNRSYASYSRPQKISAVGTISTPPQAPGLEGSATWLKTGHVWDRAGGYYRIRETWRASGKAGWDTDLYK